MQRPFDAVRILATLIVAGCIAGPGAGLAFAEEDNDGAFHSLDSVDTGETHDLDEVDTGRTHALGEVDTGTTKSLDSVDTGETESLESVSNGRTESLDSVDTGRTADLDAVVQRTFEAPGDSPAPPAKIEFPAIEDGDWERQASQASGYVAAAEKRLRSANASYSNMMHNDYPRGDARARIIEERDAAHVALNDSHSYLARIRKLAGAAGRPL
jgi:hypothetical protein